MFNTLTALRRPTSTCSTYSRKLTVLEPEESKGQEPDRQSLDEANFELHHTSEEILEALSAAKIAMKELHRVSEKLESIVFQDDHYERLRTTTLAAVNETLGKVDNGLEVSEQGVLGIFTTAASLIRRDLEKTTEENRLHVRDSISTTPPND